MKPNILSSVVIALAMSVLSSCGDKGREVEDTDERGVPQSVASMLMSDTCRIDTLYVSEDNVVRFVRDTDYGQAVLFDSHGLLAYNPTLQVDSLRQNVYAVSDLIKNVEVDFGDAQSFEAFRKVFPVYDKFRLVTYADTRRTPVSATYSLSASSPTEELQHNAEIGQWIACAIDSVPFDGSFRNLGHHQATMFFGSFDTMPDNMWAYMYVDALAYWMTSKYVTVLDVVNTYSGGAHGLYAYDFRTYLIDENMPLTKEYMFKEGSEEGILKLIFEALAADRGLSTNQNINNPVQAERYARSYAPDGEVMVPEPALLSDGVVFCYQPYEIGCYADGAFQLVIPFEKLVPYMTEKGKLLAR